MANNDPRIKFFAENSPYVQARMAREAQAGRKPVDWAQVRRVPDAYAEAQVASDAKRHELSAQQAENPYNFTNIVARTGWRQPPGSPWLPSKYRLVNGYDEPEQPQS